MCTNSFEISLNSMNLTLGKLHFSIFNTNVDCQNFLEPNITIITIMTPVFFMVINDSWDKEYLYFSL